MSHDAVIRAAAVVAAIALLAAPYRQQILGWLATAAQAAKARRSTICRVAAAVLLIGAAWGKIPLPRLTAGAAVINVPTPSAELQSAVEPVAKALAGLPAADRNLWASLWTKAGVVVAGDAVQSEVILRDSRALRSFTTLAVDIGWRRIGGHEPGSVPGLRQAVEAAYGQVVGTDDVPVTAELRARYAALASAIAWAATR